MSDEKKDCWDLDTVTEATETVIFESAVTKKEAIKLRFVDKEYVDIIGTDIYETFDGTTHEIVEKDIDGG